MNLKLISPVGESLLTSIKLRFLKPSSPKRQLSCEFLFSSDSASMLVRLFPSDFFAHLRASLSEVLILTVASEMEEDLPDPVLNTRLVYYEFNNLKIHTKSGISHDVVFTPNKFGIPEKTNMLLALEGDCLLMYGVAAKALLKALLEIETQSIAIIDGEFQTIWENESTNIRN